MQYCHLLHPDVPLPPPSTRRATTEPSTHSLLTSQSTPSQPVAFSQPAFVSQPASRAQRDFAFLDAHGSPGSSTTCAFIRYPAALRRPTTHATCSATKPVFSSAHSSTCLQPSPSPSSFPSRSHTPTLFPTIRRRYSPLSIASCGSVDQTF